MSDTSPHVLQLLRWIADPRPIICQETGRRAPDPLTGAEANALIVDRLEKAIRELAEIVE